MGLSDEEYGRAAFVDANALLKDECGVEYKKPSQVQYYALFKDHEALKHVADMLGCMTYIKRWQTALKTKPNLHDDTE